MSKHNKLKLIKIWIQNLNWNQHLYKLQYHTKISLGTSLAKRLSVVSQLPQCKQLCRVHKTML